STSRHKPTRALQDHPSSVHLTWVVRLAPLAVTFTHEQFPSGKPWNVGKDDTTHVWSPYVYFVRRRRPDPAGAHLGEVGVDVPVVARPSTSAPVLAREARRPPGSTFARPWALGTAVIAG